jgi:hypothetical protein
MRGVVHEHVDPAKLGHGSLHEVAAMAGIRDIAGNDNTFSAGAFDELSCLHGILVFVEVGDQYVRALTREGEGDRAANTGVGPGYQYCLVMKPAGAAITVLPVVWPGVHRIAGTRHRPLLGLKWRPGELIVHI